MKKIIAFMAAAALPALMFAAPAQANDGSIDNSMSGFYVGGFGGHTWNNVDVSGAPSFDINGSDYGVFAGYKVESLLGTNAPINLSGAIEANYGWSHANETHLVGATPVEIRKDREWGVNFRPGLTFLSSAMPLGLHPYGIFGYRAADYKSSSAGTTTHNGFDLGIGTELLAYKNFGVRVDYDHVFYDEKNGISPNENDLRLGVAYHF